MTDTTVAPRVSGIEVVTSEFSHVANAESGWYVLLRGSLDEVMGDAGLAAAEAEAVRAGWDAAGRAGAGFPIARNLRQYERAFWFYGKELWQHHGQCWCRHRFCGHRRAWSEPHACNAPAPFTLA